MIKKRKNDLNFCSILEGLQTNVCEVFSIAVISGFTACKFTMVVYIVKNFLPCRIPWKTTYVLFPVIFLANSFKPQKSNVSVKEKSKNWFAL